ncbi:MAG: phosphodiesterase [Burkholderiales bacterium PBB4]|nr:MAG: phosphodiesterase [Burkholderiales bacterium PBB4]
MTDDLVFSDEQDADPCSQPQNPWKVMVVDDEPAVHEVTELVMSGFEMDGRGLAFTHCYSAAEAHAVLSKPNDIALILLDVGMESEHAGLDLARQIREDIGNLNVRIVLRTGQPGQAPEEQVIKDYDINDYKEKTDLTRRKLITIFYAGLRAYRDLMRIEHARQGLRRSIEAISQVYDSQNLRSFASAVLEQVNFLLDLNAEGLCAARLSAYTANSANGHIKVLAATQAYSGLLVDEEVHNLPPGVKEALERALKDKTSHHADGFYAGYFKTKAGSESIIYMSFPEPINQNARELLELFSRNVAITYDGLLLRDDLEQAQRETIAILGSAIERRTWANTSEMHRIGLVAALLATQAGCNEREAELMRLAVTLHDVGKGSVPEEILNKPGPLAPEEWTLMRMHPGHGHALLGQAKSPLHEVAATMALEHHEHWDGSGYPRALTETQISLAGRIAAVADVLDSLVCACAYREAWTFAEAFDYLVVRSGSQFDPALIRSLLAKRAEIEAIYA